jgi:hypothetical protein
MLNECDSRDSEDFLHNICGKIQEEEFCRILDLRKNLQVSDVLIQYMSHYLNLGWHLAAVNAQNRVNPCLDFQEPKQTWSEKLIELSLDGIELNVGVRTGSASGLMVLEVHKEGRTLPFRRGDWSSECVAEAGAQFEQHYYELLEGWQLPASFSLEPFEVKVFGEGSLVLAPPSREPRVQANWRWLQPPWDLAPSQPPPVLRKIIEVTAPGPDTCRSAPVIPLWEQIYPAIASYPTVLQALMNPAASPDSYYQGVLAAAGAVGLKDPDVLLGLLWHAPLGDARERPQGWQYLQQVLQKGVLSGPRPAGRPPDEAPVPAADSGQPMPAMAREPGRGAGPRPRPWPVEQDYGRRSASGPAAPSAAWPGEMLPASDPQPGGAHPGNGGATGSWQEFFRASQENLVVERHR